MDFIYVTVNYGGNWIDCSYNNGRDVNVPLSRNAISLYDLRYHITNICSLGSNDFEVFCLKTSSRRGRLIKSRITNDEELLRLCNRESSPTVYVISNNRASSSHAVDAHGGASSSYVHTFDQSHQYGGSFGFESESTNWQAELEQISRAAASTNWMGNVPNLFREELGCRRNTIPDLNRTDGDAQQFPEGRSLIEDDDDDDDYEIENEDESQSDGELEDDSGRRMNRALFAEYTAWIQEEGGMLKFLQMMYSDPHAGDDEIEHDSEHMNNWIVPMVPIRPTSSAVLHEDNLITEGLGINAVYYSKEELGIAVGIWNLEKMAESRVVKSDRVRVVLKCRISSECTFRLRAISEGGPWLVSRFFGDHTCNQDILTNVVRRKVHSKVIGAYYAKKILRDSEIMKPKIIKNELQSLFGVHVSYDVALRGRNCAIEMIYGKYEESFKVLPGYLHMLERANEGTITDLDIGPDGRFQHVFVALGATRAAYTTCIRPVIVVDGTHLKGKNNGTLFVAVAKDANEQLFPLAFGIGPIERDISWTWFMRRLKRAYGAMHNTMIVSDQHISIEHAVIEVFPEASHGLCYYHLSKKMVKFGKIVGGLFQRAAYTYDKTEFQDIMKMIRAVRPEAYQKLVDIGPQKWARSMCPVRRYSNLTSNVAESFNNTLIWARRLPVCACLDAVRFVIEEWFDERRARGRNDAHPVAEEARKKIAFQQARSHEYSATQLSDKEFRVVTAKRTVLVNLEKFQCQCLQWQFDCIPCAHSIAAMRERGDSIMGYVAHYYLRATYVETYKFKIHRVPNKKEWTLPPNILDVDVLPPCRVILSGRPRENRIRGRIERGRGGRRRARRCPHCDMVDHTGPNCPYNQD